MKSIHPEFYRLVKSVFHVFCREHDLKPFSNSVVFEHGQFWGLAEDGYTGEERNFSVVDACCPHCAHGAVDYCFFCKRHNQLDFEEV